VTLESSKGDPVEVTADKLESVLPVATLTGTDKDHPVHIVRGKDEVFGDVVELNQDKKTFVIPGPGRFLLTLQDKKSKQPTPMLVTWTGDMRFDQKTLLALFTGKVLAETQGKALEPGKLACDRLLTVKLLNAVGKGGENGDLETAGAGGLDYILAEGNVDTRATQFDADNKVLTDMDLNADKLLYAAATHLLTVPVPGAMTLADHRPEKVKVAKTGEQDAQSMRGDSVFGWQGSFTFDTDKNVITFRKEVIMQFIPEKPFHVAEQKDASGNVKAASPVVLNTEILQATLVRTKGKTGDNSVSPVGLGEGGNFDLGEVKAGGVAGVGAATISMEDFKLSGYTIGFDKEKHVIKAEGNDSMPASAVRENKGMVEAKSILWDLTAGSNRFQFEGDPVGTFEAINDLQN
jgi:hypothetical protein